jgi:hypothetical protein
MLRVRNGQAIAVGSHYGEFRQLSCILVRPMIHADGHPLPLGVCVVFVEVAVGCRNECRVSHQWGLKPRDVQMMDEARVDFLEHTV